MLQQLQQVVQQQQRQPVRWHDLAVLTPALALLLLQQWLLLDLKLHHR